MPDTLVIKIVAGVAIIVIALLVILLPMSFSTLEYYEYGFRRQKSTGKVDLTEVFSMGKHFLGPDFEFKVFRAGSHQISLYRISGFTQDKLEVRVSATFQYFLRKRDLPLLHQAYDIHYEDVMKSSAIDALKGGVPVFTTRQMFKNRTLVEQVLFKAVRERLGGTCCPENSNDCRLYIEGCATDCRQGRDCKERYRGIFVDVKFFQLHSVEIPGDVIGRYLKSLTLQEDDLREQLLQNGSIVRKETDQMVRNILNNATEIRQVAESKSATIESMSLANYTNVIEKARSRGLRQLYTSLGITDQAHKNSFDYLRTLRGLDNVHITVDFQQRIAGNL